MANTVGDTRVSCLSGVFSLFFDSNKIYGTLQGKSLFKIMSTNTRKKYPLLKYYLPHLNLQQAMLSVIDHMCGVWDTPKHLPISLAIARPCG